MASKVSLTTEAITRAESLYGIRAGVARLSDILKGYSYQVGPEDEEHKNHMDEVPANWPAEARSVLVWGLHHPASEPKLEWWKRGNSLGNRRLIDISESLKHWLWKEHNRVTLPIVARKAIRLMPILENLKVRRAWRGQIPMTPDGFPFVGKMKELDNFYQAGGMSGQGFMMGPGIAELVYRMITETHYPEDDEILKRFDQYRSFDGEEVL